VMVKYIARFDVKLKEGTRKFKVRGATDDLVIYDVEVPVSQSGTLEIHNLESRAMTPDGFFRRTGWRKK